MESRLEAPRTESRTCSEHGQYQASEMYRGLWTQCPGCAAAREEAERVRQEAEDAARRKARMHALLQQSGLRGRYLQATFDSFNAALPKQADVLQTCRGYVENVRVGDWSPLWLIGPPGTGKTHLASAMVWAPMQK